MAFIFPDGRKSCAAGKSHAGLAVELDRRLYAVENFAQKTALLGDELAGSDESVTPGKPVDVDAGRNAVTLNNHFR